jgi:hypothetical protein
MDNFFMLSTYSGHISVFTEHKNVSILDRVSWNKHPVVYIQYMLCCRAYARYEDDLQAPVPEIDDVIITYMQYGPGPSNRPVGILLHQEHIKNIQTADSWNMIRYQMWIQKHYRSFCDAFCNLLRIPVFMPLSISNAFFCPSHRKTVLRCLLFAMCYRWFE